MIKFNLVNISLEAKHFKKLGLPILVSQLVMYAMTTTDTSWQVIIPEMT